MDLRKVYGGTPVGQGSQCDTCVYARSIRGYGQREKITICERNFQPFRIPFQVMECTDYVDKRLPCIEDLELMAWELRSKSAGKRAGFAVAGTSADPDEEAPFTEQPGELPAAAKTE